MAAKRSHVIALMRGAFRRGQSATAFIWNMRERGLGYRRTEMLSDWRSVGKLEQKEGLMQYVRKDRVPTEKVFASVTWKITPEYMYVCKVRSRVHPDDPIVERRINIMQDIPITPAQVEELAWAMIKEQSPKVVSQVVEIMPWTAVHRVYE